MDTFKSLCLDESSIRHKLNRSMSLSELSPRKKITVQQKLLSGPSGDTVYRHCSYEELSVIPGTSSLRFSQKFISELHVNLSGNNSVPKFEMSKDLRNDYSDKFVAPTKKISEVKLHSKEIEQYRKRPHEPSDVISNYKRKKLLTLNPVLSDSELKNTLNICKDQHPSRTVAHFLWIVIPVLLVVFATFAMQYASYQKTCNSTLDVNALEHLLSSSIFGQGKAMKDIVETFKKFYSSKYENLQVMVFTGATGVGKTFAASILEEVFPWKHNIHHFIMPIDFENLSQYFLQRFPYCGDHLVIMDNLNEEDIKYVGYIVSYLKKLAEKSKVTAILIFKFHKQLAGKISEAEVIENSQKVQSNVIQNGVNCEMIDFKALEKCDIIQCIRKALTQHWIPVSDETVNTILNQVDYRSEGCKRISSKIAVVNELWVRHL